MEHKIISVKPLENMILSVVFQNGVEKTYDMRSMYPVFEQLKELETDEKLFKQVKVDAGGYGVSWNETLDLDADEIWDNGVATGMVYETDAACQLAHKLSTARQRAGITQKQLSEVTGICQADISRIEQGISNPSVSTLNRLAEGMGMKLLIDFSEESNQ